MILVVGATGLLGSEICRRLRAAGQSVRALVRAGSGREKVEALQAAGVATAIADLKDPGSIFEACKGVAGVITTASSTFSRQEGDSIETVDRQGYLNLIEAARKAGVGRFIYTSIPPDMHHDCPLTAAKREIESALARSGLNFTVLLANYFMEVWLSPALGFDYGNGTATIYGSGERPLAWVSYRDVAGFAVDSLENAGARNRKLLVGGPENLTPHDVVRIFEDTAGRSFGLKYVPEDALCRQYAEAADPLNKSFAALMLEYAHGCPMDVSETLSILPRKLTTVRDYAAAAGRLA
jgi:NADH dehydrogenase